MGKSEAQSNVRYERYKIALAKAKEVECMNMSEYRKQELYMKLGEWIESDEEELPFPFGKTPKRI